jgi:cytochrome c biogenesis factor
MLAGRGTDLRPTDNSISTRLLVGLIMAGLAAWGLFHAVGAYRYDSLRGLVVLAFFAVFIGFWLVMLAWRKRSSREDPP